MAAGSKGGRATPGPTISRLGHCSGGSGGGGARAHVGAGFAGCGGRGAAAGCRETRLGPGEVR